MKNKKIYDKKFIASLNLLGARVLCHIANIMVSLKVNSSEKNKEDCVIKPICYKFYVAFDVKPLI